MRRLLRLTWFSVVVLLAALSALPAFAQEEGATHVVQPGENLFRIALRYGVDINGLAQANGIGNTWQIYSGQTLVIPGSTPVETAPAEPTPAPADAAPAPVEAAPADAPLYHTVGRGENLAAIANQYSITPEQIATWNSLGNLNLIYAGQQLIVGTSSTPADVSLDQGGANAAPVTGTTYTVQPGEHLATIAARYGVTWTQLAQANNLVDPNRVFAGQTLIIPGSETPAVSDAGIVSLPAAPAASVTVGRSIVVDLSDSRIYAYEDGALVRNVLASTGLPATPTVQGDFTVQRKYSAQTMSGPGYYLPDVPYVMYFYSGYAIHGTYWHNNFGVPMSHGCVNLPTPEAEWFYNWADFGTPVRVQF